MSVRTGEQAIDLQREESGRPSVFLRSNYDHTGTSLKSVARARLGTFDHPDAVDVTHIHHTGYLLVGSARAASVDDKKRFVVAGHRLGSPHQDTDVIAIPLDSNPGEPSQIIGKSDRSVVNLNLRTAVA